MVSGRKPIYTSVEELEEAKRSYNRRYYEKKTQELKTKRDTKRKENRDVINYTDEQLLEIINKVGYLRILKLLI
jgi:thermostable 8-oxoguanine DNA glycosylase